jgi:hypothetical protein
MMTTQRLNLQLVVVALFLLLFAAPAFSQEEVLPTVIGCFKNDDDFLKYIQETLKERDQKTGRSEPRFLHMNHTAQFVVWNYQTLEHGGVYIWRVNFLRQPCEGHRKKTQYVKDTGARQGAEYSVYVPLRLR